MIIPTEQRNKHAHSDNSRRSAPRGWRRRRRHARPDRVADLRPNPRHRHPENRPHTDQPRPDGPGRHGPTTLAHYRATSRVRAVQRTPGSHTLYTDGTAESYQGKLLYK